MIINHTAASLQHTIQQAVHTEMLAFQRKVIRVLDDKPASVSTKEFLTKFKKFFQIYGEEAYFEKVVASILVNGPSPDSTESMRSIVINLLPGIPQKSPSPSSSPRVPAVNRSISDESDLDSDYSYITEGGFYDGSEGDQGSDYQTTPSSTEHVRTQPQPSVTKKNQANTTTRKSKAQHHPAKLAKTSSTKLTTKSAPHKPNPSSIIDLSGSAEPKSTKRKSKSLSSQVEVTPSNSKRPRLTEQSKSHPK